MLSDYSYLIYRNVGVGAYPRLIQSSLVLPPISRAELDQLESRIVSIAATGSES